MCKNEFDFNKLYREGLTYRPISDIPKIEEAVRREVGELPKSNKSYTNLGSQSQKNLATFIEQVKSYIEMCNTKNDTPKKLEL